ncbi:MAG: hypothetical protein QM765_05900 [Myxococcales bacterium]
MTLALFLAIALAQSPTAEAAADAGAVEAGDAGHAATTDELTRQLDEVLSGGPASAPAPDGGAAPQQPAQAGSAPLLKIGGASLMNPEISILFDGVAGYATGLPYAPSGDDPELGGDATHAPAGFTLQELELGFQATVDPYFTANVFLAIPNLQGVEVEEAYAQTLSLPWNLQLKAGVFRSSAGRQNEQHLHVQDFSRRPMLNAAYLGDDGLRSPGVQVSWLAPTPFFLKAAVEAFSIERSDAQSFGGSLRTDPTFVATLKTFVPLAEDVSLMVGASSATGHAALEGLSEVENGPRTWLFGADLYLKWKPPNTSEHYFALALQAEYYWRRTAGTSSLLPQAQTDGGLYVQLVAQLSRRWHAGARYDLLGVPESVIQSRADRITAMLMFTPTEFSRVRLQASRQSAPDVKEVWEALLLLEFSMGAHGAHAF